MGPIDLESNGLGSYGPWEQWTLGVMGLRSNRHLEYLTLGVMGLVDNGSYRPWELWALGVMDLESIMGLGSKRPCE